MVDFSILKTVEWKAGSVIIIDQTRLPDRLVRLRLRKPGQVAQAIKRMAVRGAPAIGIAAAMGIALAAYRSRARTREGLLREIEGAANLLRRSRPTARNLFWAIDRMLATAKLTKGSASDLVKALIEEAQKMADEDIRANMLIGEHGSKLLNDGDTVLTHCN